MILSQIDIRKRVEAGDIGFDPPLEEKQWGEASIDLRLGFQFTRYKDDVKGVTLSVADGLKTVGALGLWNTKELKLQDELGVRESYDLEHGKFVLALTHDQFASLRTSSAWWRDGVLMLAWGSACIRQRHGFSLAGADLSSWK